MKAVKMRHVMWFALLVGVCVTFLVLRPLPKYDVSRVEPRLRALQKPYRSVTTGYAMDGGSIGIEIVDRNGIREQFAIPAHLGDTNPYSKVFVGAMHDRRPSAVLVADSKNS